MTPVELLLSKLTDAKPAGKGWSSRCPAHDDGRASLSINEGDDGRALVKCFAGCSVDAISKAVGLRVLDLMPTANKLPTPKKRSAVPETFATARDAITELERRHGPRAASWTYQDAHGEPVGVVVRWNRPDGKKDIRPISRHGDSWRVGGMPEPRPLYCLPDLAGARRVFVCEGEKAADAARSIGLTATTSAHGAQSPAKTDWRPLAGKEIVILPDNDLPGHKYGDTVAGLLAKLTPTPVVKVVELPDLPDHGDIVDWVEARPDAGPDDLRQQVETLADGTEPLGTMPALEPGPVLTCMADVEPREVSWLWNGRIPLGRITLLVGRPGEGKSFFTTDAAARVTTGTPWPDGSDCPEGSVILISAEDDPGDTIRPRLDAHYANVKRVHLLSAVRRIDGKGHFERLITLADVDAIEAALAQQPDCKLIIVDPIGSFLGGGTDAHRDNEVRGVLAPVAKLAEKYGPAVLVVAHRRKSAGAIADDMALGSRAFTGIARAVWHLTRDTKNKARRLLLPGKNNLAREGNGLAFSIIGEPARIAWERDPVAMSADDALVAENQSHMPGPDGEALDAASTWLRSVLADGPRLARDLYDEWKNGQGGSESTLKRAKQCLGIEAYRPKIPGPWLWRFSNKMPNESEGKELGRLEPLAENGENPTDFDEGALKGAKLLESGLLESGRVRVTI